MPPGATLKVEMIQVSLTPQEQALFIDFKRQQDNWTKIISSGALGIKDGSFTCYLDHDGLIRKIDSNKRLYAS